MISSDNFKVFERYEAVGQHAFSNEIVNEADKDLYQETFAALIDAANEAVKKSLYREVFKTWSVRFYRDGGVQGHRPVDLWVCIINAESEVFARYPQI